MTYYDHAIALTFKLDQWSEEPVPRSYELELLARERETQTKVTKKSSLLMRCLAAFHLHHLLHKTSSHKT